MCTGEFSIIEDTTARDFCTTIWSCPSFRKSRRDFLFIYFLPPIVSIVLTLINTSFEMCQTANPRFRTATIEPLFISAIQNSTSVYLKIYIWVSSFSFRAMNNLMKNRDNLKFSLFKIQLSSMQFKTMLTKNL